MMTSLLKAHRFTSLLRPPSIRAALSRLVALGSLVAACALVTPGNAYATSGADAVSGSAFGATVALLNTTVVPPTPAVTLPANGAAQSANLVSIPINPLVGAGVLTVTTAATQATQPTEVVNSSAGVANAALINGIVDPGNLGASVLSADVIHTVCTSSATGSTGGTTFVSLVIDGTPVPVSDAINQVPALPAALSPLLSVEINKQVITNSVGATGITVDGVVITLLSGVDNGAVIVLAQSKCGATGPDINAPPTVTGVVPNSGPTTGGTTVTITGTGFQCVSGVKFGTTPALNFTVVSPTQITATSPPGVVGTIDVTVTTCHGTSPTGTADQYTYVATTSSNTGTGVATAAETALVTPAVTAPLAPVVGVTG